MPRYEAPTYTPPDIEMPSYEPPTYTPPTVDYSSGSELGQTYETQCMSCNRTVSSNSKVGEKCPHCGVRWTHEEDEYGNTINAGAVGVVVGIGIVGFIGLFAVVGGVIAVATRSGKKSTPYPAHQQNVWNQHQQNGYGQPQHNAWQQQQQQQQQQQNAWNNQQQTANQQQQSGNFFSDWHET